MFVTKLSKLSMVDQRKYIYGLYQLIGDAFYFIEIGAMDGITFDPFYKISKILNLKGLLVEPNPVQFKRLAKTYRGRDVILENIAISNKDGDCDLYINTKSPGQTSTLYNSNIKKSNTIKKITVKCLKYTSLLNKYNINELSFVHIDAEGLDYIIIKDILNSSVHPIMIEFEANILTSNEDAKKCIQVLTDNDYKVFHLKYKFACYDCLAIKNDYYSRIISNLDKYNYPKGLFIK